MTTDTATVADVLRPLAERVVECPDSCAPVAVFEDGQEDAEATCLACGETGGHGKVPDPRFDALRCEHKGGMRRGCESEPDSCRNCGESFHDASGNLVTGVRTDLGAIVRAAAACGFKWFILSVNPTGERECRLLHEVPMGSPIPDQIPDAIGFGVSDQEAAARALVAAVGDGHE